ITIDDRCTHQLEISTNRPRFLTGDKFSTDSGKEYLELTYSARMKCAIMTDCAKIAHNVSTNKRKEIVEHVAQLDTVVTNELARLRSQEDERELLQLTLRWKLCSWPTWSATDMTLDKVVDYIKKETDQFFHCS
ncbi:60S ribosomal protein L32-1-like protein, partial [Tanacetum coccineum]